MKTWLRCLAVALLPALVAGSANAQAPNAPQRGATPRDAASIDLTGYWVSVVTEDWLYRMVTPAKGDYTSVPLNAEGRKVADAWDPAKDEAAGNQCKAYGAAAIMRVPGRLHITWQDANTLKVEMDSGTQTRFLYFGAPAAAVAKGGRLAGRFRRVLGRGGRSARSDSRRRLEGHHDPVEGWVSSEERCSLQRQRADDRILRSRQRVQR